MTNRALLGTPTPTMPLEVSPVPLLAALATVPRPRSALASLPTTAVRVPRSDDGRLRLRTGFAALSLFALAVIAPRPAQAGDESVDESAEQQAVGAPDLGHLLNGRRLRATRRIRLRFPTNTWGTTALVDGLHGCVDAVHRKHGRSHVLVVGDMSRKGGGMLLPHEGHQNGREADTGIFLRAGKPLPGLWRMAAQDVDAARTLTFLECWIDSGSLLRAFLDRSLQAPLVREAERRGWSAEKIASTFSYPRAGHERVGLIQHRSHHDNHLHLRLRCAPHEPSCIDEPYGAKARRAMAQERSPERAARVTSVAAGKPRGPRKQGKQARRVANRSAKRAAKRVGKRPVLRIAKQPAKRVAKRPAERVAKRPAERVAKRPAKRAAKRPAKQGARRPGLHVAQPRRRPGQPGRAAVRAGMVKSQPVLMRKAAPHGPRRGPSRPARRPTERTTARD